MDVKICPQVFAEYYLRCNSIQFYHYSAALHGILIAIADVTEVPLGRPPDRYDTYFRDKTGLLLWHNADSLGPDNVHGVCK